MKNLIAALTVLLTTILGIHLGAIQMVVKQTTVSFHTIVTVSLTLVGMQKSLLIW